jgi:hypothetical protein
MSTKLRLVLSVLCWYHIQLSSNERHGYDTNQLHHKCRWWTRLRQRIQSYQRLRDTYFAVAMGIGPGIAFACSLSITNVKRSPQAIIELRSGQGVPTPMEWPYNQETNQEQATSMRLSTSFKFVVLSRIEAFPSQVTLEESAIFLSLRCE